jgi:hypothetical protein
MAGTAELCERSIVAQPQCPGVQPAPVIVTGCPTRNEVELTVRRADVLVVATRSGSTGNVVVGEAVIGWALVWWAVVE